MGHTVQLNEQRIIFTTDLLALRQVYLIKNNQNPAQIAPDISEMMMDNAKSDKERMAIQQLLEQWKE